MATELRTCNNCNVEKCKGNMKSYCNNHQFNVPTAQLRYAVSKVVVTDSPTTNETLHLLKAWM